MQIKNNKMGKGNKSVSQIHPIMKHMSNSAFKKEGVAQQRANLEGEMPIDNRASATPKMGSMKNDGMSKYGPLDAHHPMKKMGSMKKDGMPKHGQPFHDYGKPMHKMGYKK